MDRGVCVPGLVCFEFSVAYCLGVFLFQCLSSALVNGEIIRLYFAEILQFCELDEEGASESWGRVMDWSCNTKL